MLPAEIFVFFATYPALLLVMPIVLCRAIPGMHRGRRWRMALAVVGIAAAQWYASVIASLYAGFGAGLILNVTGIRSAIEGWSHALAERVFLGLWQCVFLGAMCVVTLALYRLASWKRIMAFVFSTARDRRLAALTATALIVILHAVMTIGAERNTMGPLLFLMTGEIVTTSEVAHPAGR